MTELATEVLIVGAGPTGLFLAIDLCRRGVSFLLIDRSEEPARTSRALNLQGGTLRALDRLGVLEHFLASGLVVRSVSCYSRGRLRNRFGLEDGESPYPLLLTIEQRYTESILSNSLREHGVGVQRGWELEAIGERCDHILSLVRTPAGPVQVCSSYVVGCDGPDSQVRQSGEIGFTQVASDMVYHLADVQLVWDLPTAEIVWMVDRHTEIVAFPLRGDRFYRLNMWASSYPGEGGAQSLDLPTWQRILERLAPCDVNLVGPASIMSYRPGHGLAETFRRGRILLAGDAAHVLPQCAADGLNLGLQDAQCLGEKLGLVFSGEAPPESLSSYHVERWAVADAALAPSRREPTLFGRACHLESPQALARWSRLFEA